VVRGGGCGWGSRGGRCTNAGRITACRAPRCLITDGDLAHLGDKGAPGEGGLFLTEERIGLQATIVGRGAVGEHEAHRDLIHGWVRLGDVGDGDQFKGHARRVLDDAGEVCGDGRELGESEEGEVGGIDAELDAEFFRGIAVDEGGELLDDLCSEGGAGNGTDGFTGVIS